jgi:hypothetical protein
MQFPISDPAAIQFSTELYRTLADRYPVDAAVNEARRAIYLGGNVLEWGTPVLFMRAEDGMIFAGDKDMDDQDKQSPRQGGVNITGGQVSVGRDLVGGDRVTHGDEYDVGGDVNIVSIGAGAQVGQAAAGKDIRQSSGSAGAGSPDTLPQRLLELNAALQAARAQVDPSKLALAEFQLQLLQNELTKVDGTPSGSSITTAADGLLAIVPALRGPLTAVMSTPAARTRLKQAGVEPWARERFG